MPIRILVVDDATFIRDMVKKTIRDKVATSEVYDAADGHRAIATLKSQNIDLILSDWEMPGMTGAELLEWVRSNDSYKDTPFVMVSSRGDRNYVIQAVESGVSDYLTKPFTPDELLKKVNKQLKKINKLPKEKPSKHAATQGVANASVEALTGTRSQATPKSQSANEEETDPQSDSAKSSATSAKPNSRIKAKAQLRFPNNQYPCVIRELTLQSLCGLIQRSETLPTIFDQAVVDIEADNGESVARINGYVHSIQAGENKVDTKVVKLTINFVDNDPEKFKFLAQYIAQL